MSEIAQTSNLGALHHVKVPEALWPAILDESAGVPALPGLIKSLPPCPSNIMAMKTKLYTSILLYACMHAESRTLFECKAQACPVHHAVSCKARGTMIQRVPMCMLHSMPELKVGPSFGFTPDA